MRDCAIGKMVYQSYDEQKTGCEKEVKFDDGGSEPRTPAWSDARYADWYVIIAG